MAWSGFREAAAGESGLELSLGLPAYFTKPAAPPAGLDGQESSGAGAGDFARHPDGGSNGSKAKPAAAAAPVVGWPPVRSFRRNLAASKPSSSKEDGRASKDKGADEPAGRKGLFVKVNMDGVPIGRKVELKEDGSYADLSATVDKLFRSLLAVFPACACSSKGRRRCPRRDRRRRVHAGVRGRRGRQDAGRGRPMADVHRHSEEAARAEELRPASLVADGGREQEEAGGRGYN
ncbi:auxin-responsive protein IAA2 isoform X2 [Triticum aestivum]|uniref:auxin-responsive protein IAA2 isoform X2 n=1 Tax=Triticum aestivum TaxID=4565 RepID=UPI001D01B0DF|nr:auxin-responsive protein IAA2-like isoform X2 [Triticum aestivum]